VIAIRAYFRDLGCVERGLSGRQAYQRKRKRAGTTENIKLTLCFIYRTSFRNDYRKQYSSSTVLRRLYSIPVITLEMSSTSIFRIMFILSLRICSVLVACREGEVCPVLSLAEVTCY